MATVYTIPLPLFPTKRYSDCQANTPLATVETRECPCCHRVKTISEFERPGYGNPCLHVHQCNACLGAKKNVYAKERRAKRIARGEHPTRRQYGTPDAPIVPTKTKRCIRCQKEKPSSQFGSCKYNRDGRVNYCRECRSVAQKATYVRDHERLRKNARRSELKRHYGLTIAEHEQMKEKQGGVCAICGKPPGKKGLAVDHDHRTGKVRSLLCSPCNIGLGAFGDTPDNLLRAVEYLKRWLD